MLKKTALALSAATLVLAGCSNSNDSTTPSLTFYVTDGASIYTVNTSNTLIADEKTLTGLNAGTLLAAIDANPRGGAINGIGTDGQSYTVDPATGTLTPRGTRDTTNNLNGKAVEIDYNPTVPNQMVYRVTASGGENYRVNDTTGAKVAGPGTTANGSAGVAGNDLLFQYRAGDPNAGRSVVVSGIAYTDSQVNAGVPPRTAIYAIDSQNRVLSLLGANPADGAACPNATNPNCGQLTTVGPLGVNASAFVGFDIVSAGTSGMAATSNTGFVTTFENGTYNLYSVNLNSGAMSFLTAINPKIVPVRSIAFRL